MHLIYIFLIIIATISIALLLIYIFLILIPNKNVLEIEKKYINTIACSSVSSNLSSSLCTSPFTQDTEYKYIYTLNIPLVLNRKYVIYVLVRQNSQIIFKADVYDYQGNDYNFLVSQPTYSHSTYVFDPVNYQLVVTLDKNLANQIPSVLKLDSNVKINRQDLTLFITGSISLIGITKKLGVEVMKTGLESSIFRT